MKASHSKWTELRSSSGNEKEMDELKNAIKGKIDRNLDRMVRTMDSPFTMAILEYPVLSKFCLP